VRGGGMSLARECVSEVKGREVMAGYGWCLAFIPQICIVASHLITRIQAG
jgi:hypothetical protein